MRVLFLLLRGLLGLARLAAWLALVASGLLALLVVLEGPAGELPWAPLDLGRPADRFAGTKLAALHDDPGACRTLLWRAGLRVALVPPHADVPECRFSDGVRLRSGGTLPAELRPAAPVMACPLAAAFALWEWQVVAPAARATLGRRVVAIEHYGTFSCRRIYGRATGDWSEHAAADAIDVAGFVLADRRRITVASDWRKDDATGRFLHAVRDGGCRIFATVLSPDYNAAHRDHLHLDEAARGRWGWRLPIGAVVAVPAGSR